MEADDKGEDIMKKVLICKGEIFLEYDESTVNWYLDSGSNVVAIVVKKGLLDTYEAYKVVGHGEVNDNFVTNAFALALVKIGEQHE